MIAAAVPASAQYIGASPPPPAPLAPGEVLAPADALARYVRFLALNPHDFTALIGAGRAALDTGDTQAAIGFFGRAQDVRPTDPAPRLGMGAVDVAVDNIDGALAYFAQAQRYGAAPAALGLDRGLAFDLKGQQAAAQADYRLALAGPDSDEARRRLALSLGISGDRAQALATLQPLLARGDPGAARGRAFVLALTGQQAEATRAIDQAMPGTGSRFAPFFRALPGLRAQDKAAAVHLGIFPTSLSGGGERQVAGAEPDRAALARPQIAANVEPSAREVRVESATSIASPYAAPVRPLTAEPPRPPARATVRTIGQADREANPLRTRTLVKANGVTVETPLVAPPAPAVANAAPAPALVGPPAPTVTAVAAATSPGVIEPVAADRLASIDELLSRVATVQRSTIAPIQPPPSPAVVAPPRSVQPPTILTNDQLAPLTGARAKISARKAAAAAKARDKAEAQARAEAAALGTSGTHWVQLAGGSNADRLASEFARIRSKKSALFAGHPGYVSAGKDYFRLLVGPFDDPGAAREFVNRLDKAGIDGFSWTRNPANLKIEKIPAS